MDNYYVIEILKDFNSPINSKAYRQGQRLIAWFNTKTYVISNSNHDLIPADLIKQIYKVKFEEIK